MPWRARLSPARRRGDGRPSATAAPGRQARGAPRRAQRRRGLSPSAWISRHRTRHSLQMAVSGPATRRCTWRALLPQKPQLPASPATSANAPHCAAAPPPTRSVLALPTHRSQMNTPGPAARCSTSRPRRPQKGSGGMLVQKTGLSGLRQGQHVARLRPLQPPSLTVARQQRRAFWPPLLRLLGTARCTLGFRSASGIQQSADGRPGQAQLVLSSTEFPSAPASARALGSRCRALLLVRCDRRA